MRFDGMGQGDMRPGRFRGRKLTWAKEGKWVDQLGPSRVSGRKQVKVEAQTDFAQFFRIK